ncbi:MAG: acyloxyacyl hydrolase [Verrucomicrobia bacterium]|nr:acyloxyacyl hydrolase [Verrucomicrobiota bacterium]
MVKSLPLLCVGLIIWQSTGRAAPDLSKSMAAPVEKTDLFGKGRHELDISGGFLWSPVIARQKRPTLDYAQFDLSLGCMLTSPAPLFGCASLRGNWEGLLNVFGAGVTKGPDGFLAGGRALLRYNFVQPRALWVPFLQLGVGALGDNVYEHRTQHLIGSGLEFTLVGDLGVRYFISPNWAAMFMIDIEHISNANTASRNTGVNAAGFTLGGARFF